MAMAEFLVEGIKTGEKDSCGVEIETVYCKLDKQYAIYRTIERVLVQFADNDQLNTDGKKVGAQQRYVIAPLNPVRGEINGLIDGWRRSKRGEKQCKARLFDRRVADALATALDSEANYAADLLNKVKDDVLTERTSSARGDYLIAALAATNFVILMVWVVTSSYWPTHIVFKNVWPAAGLGALGGFFSIALSIRDRSILTDLQRRDNTIDAVLRILIGAISAVVLYCLLRAGIVEFKIGAAQGKDIFEQTCTPKNCTVPGQYLLLVIAFVAGFVERLVSGLLANVAGAIAVRTNPIAGGLPARPAGSPAPKKDGAPPGGDAPQKKDPGDGPPVAATDGNDGDQGSNIDPADPAEHTADVNPPEAADGIATAPATGEGPKEGA
jgi:hypothetical protein